MKILISILSIILFSSCTTIKPHILEYRLNPTINTTDIKHSSCHDKSLKIAQAFSSPYLMLKDMSYAQGAYKKDFFTQSQWAEAPNRAITSQILKTVQESNIFKSVQLSKSRSRSDLLLETNIEEFIQYFSHDEQSSFSNVVINLSIIDVKTNTIVASKTFSKREKVATLNAEGGVVALNKALSYLLSEQRVWLQEEVCK